MRSLAGPSTRPGESDTGCLQVGLAPCNRALEWPLAVRNPDLAFTGGYVYLIDGGANTDLLFDRDGVIGAAVPIVLATIVNANVAQVDVAVQGFFGT